jgi:alpha-L-fucosidase
VLGGGRADVRQTGGGIEVSVPEAGRQPFVTVVALDLDGPASGIPAVEVLSAKSLTTGAKATASNVFQGMAEYGADRAVDGREDTRWATDGGTTSAWLEVDLGRPVAVGRAEVAQAFPELKRIRTFAVEYFEDGAWKACAQGRDMGETWTASLGSVTAQRVRLNIAEATDGPTIWSFDVFPPGK